MPRYLRNTDYAKKLSNEQRDWLFTALVGVNSANRQLLEQITDKVSARVVWQEAKKARAARYKDAMVQWERYSTFSDEELENCLVIYKGDEDMNTVEDALINKIDTDRRNAGLFKPYGGNAPIKQGDKVVIAVEGHYLQNKMGVVTSARRNEYLVEADSKKGKVVAYFKANELIKI